MPKPESKTVYQTQQCKFDVPADIFKVCHGYKDRSSVQIRLEPDEKIYLCDHRESRYPEQYVTESVPFDLFLQEWPKFICCLTAKMLEISQTIKMEDDKIRK